MRRCVAGLPGLRKQTLRFATRGRAEADDRYHLTLRFLGDFDALAPGMLDALGAAATGVATRPSFELLLDRIGSFGAGRVVWMGCQAPPPQLVQLHRELGDALAAAGTASQESSTFIPHLTLRRHARGPVEQAIPRLRWWARDFVLIDSSAGEYRLIGRWLLAGA